MPSVVRRLCLRTLPPCVPRLMEDYLIEDYPILDVQLRAGIVWQTARAYSVQQECGNCMLLLYALAVCPLARVL